MLVLSPSVSYDSDGDKNNINNVDYNITFLCTNTFSPVNKARDLELSIENVNNEPSLLGITKTTSKSRS